MSDAKKTALQDAKAQAQTEAELSDAKKAAIEKAKERARDNPGNKTQVAGNGPFGLPGSVSIFGVNVPTLVVLAVAGVLVVTAAALVVHFVRKPGK